MKLRIALTIALSAIVIPTLVPSPAQATSPPPPSAVAVFAKTSEWATGYVGTLTVHNRTSVPITRWRLDFGLAAGTSITSSWNGLLSRSGDRYTVDNESWNGTLAPGAKATFGYTAEGQAVPTGCTVNGAPCDGYPPPVDTTAPTRPGALTLDLTKGLVLRWGASADTSAVRYELFEDGRLRTAVTGTEYIWATDGTPPPKLYVFSVRAVDAAGNISASSFATLPRTMWRGDEIPAAPASVSYTPFSPTATRVTWPAVETASPFNPPPTGGYRVTVDGRVAGEVGQPSIVLHLSPGPHTVTVQTINAVDNLSEPVSLTVVA